MGDTVVISKSAESVTSGAETIFYVDGWAMIERAATRQRHADRPEAPFTQEILMEEVSNEETESLCSSVKLPEIKVRFGSINALLSNS